MKREALPVRRILTLSAASLLLLFLLLSGRRAPAATVSVTVPGDYTTIQAAVNAAAADTLNSYTITVGPGTHAGGIQVVSHPNALTIQGTITAGTVLTGGPAGPLIQLSGNNTGSIIIKNLFFSGAKNGVEITNNAAVVQVKNCIFALSASNSGVTVQSAPSAAIWNNTFYRNGTAVSRDAESVSVLNNLFYNNTTDIAHTNTLIGIGGIFNNLFYPDPLAGDIVGTSYQPDASHPNTNLFLVDPAADDFHIRTGPSGTSTSPAIDTGSTAAGGTTDRVDNTTPDIGAYGGPEMDIVPATVTGVVTAATTTTASISWSPNTDYRVTGYNVYYRLSTSPSPTTYVKHGTVTTTNAVISGLTGTVSPPGQPAFSAIEPSNQTLRVSWSAVAGATSYNLGYHLASDPTTTISVGNVTSYTLSGLTNGETYILTLAAVAQPTISTAVTSSYDVPAGGSGVPGVSYESDYSVEASAVFGTPAEGPSAEATGIPEPLTVYPNLPNSGCFIATAAYGSADALPVRVLRDFRDRMLLTNPAGRAFVAWYYRTSPALAAWLNRHPELKPFVRMALGPVVAAAVLVRYAPLMLLFVCAAGPLLLRWSMRRRRPL